MGYAKLVAQFMVFIAGTACIGYTKISQYNKACAEKFFQISFDMNGADKSFMKFLYVTWILSRIICLENGCTLPKLGVYRGVKKNNAL